MRDDAGAAVGANPPRGGLFLPLGGRLHLTRAEAGGKAAALSELKSAGFPVPSGFVAPRAALDARSGARQHAWDRQLQNAARAAGPGPYAVRSSAAAEDLPGASYAGMYESYMNVPAEDLPSAVIRCFGSADAGRVRKKRDGGCRPGKGAWLRYFRLGEWLPEPVTPLFMDWIVPCMDSAYNDAVFRSTGLRVPMGNAAVNGWYYVAPPTPRALPHLVSSGTPRSLPYFFNSVVRPMIDPAGADRAVLRDLELEWRTQHLPAYRSLVTATGASRCRQPWRGGLEDGDGAGQVLAQAPCHRICLPAGTGAVRRRPRSQARLLPSAAVPGDPLLGGCPAA